MKKILVFDMDGTICDFYGVQGWLECLQKSDVTPYEVADPLYDTEKLNCVLNKLKSRGWEIMVTTWCANHSTKAYENAVTQAKIEWLKKYDFPCNKVFCVPYGTPKHEVTKKFGGYQILVDDNADVRNAWNLGSTINANKNILNNLLQLLTM